MHPVGVNQIQSRAVLGGEDEIEAAGRESKEVQVSRGHVNGMIVEHDPDDAVHRVMAVNVSQKVDEGRARMVIDATRQRSVSASARSKVYIRDQRVVSVRPAA